MPSVNDKRVINGSADINQLSPMKYPWAYKWWLDQCANHWMPFDIQFTQDIADFKVKATERQKHIYVTVLATLTTSDIMALRNIGLAVMEKVTAPEIQVALARHIFDESVHIVTYQHCIESMGLDQEDIYTRYKRVPEIAQKLDLARIYLKAAVETKELVTKEDIEEFLYAYIFFTCIFEGVWFYNGFSPIFALQRRNLFKGTGEELLYIARDEIQHVALGTQIIRAIVEENNIVLDHKRITEMFEESYKREGIYMQYVLREPEIGYSYEDHMQHVMFMMNRRCRAVAGFNPFPDTKPSLPWLDEQIGLRKERNFFECRIIEYQTSSGLDFSHGDGGFKPEW